MTHDEQHEALRKFAIAMLSEFPDGDVDGAYMQDKAVELGLLEKHIVTEPCGPDCNCVDYCWADEFESGVECYRTAKWLIQEASDG